MNELIANINWEAAEAIGSVMAVMIAVLAVAFSSRQFRKSMRITHYDALDALYLNLLRSGLEKPHLRQPNAHRTPEETAEYEIYAHMAWCVAETIFDHAENDPELMSVWFSAIEIENGLHRDWFERDDNSQKFRIEFRNFVRSKFPT